MPSPALKAALIATMTILMSCTNTQQNMTNTSPTAKIDNPLLQPWSGPYGGVPAFDKMDVSVLASAMRMSPVCNSLATAWMR